MSPRDSNKAGGAPTADNGSEATPSIHRKHDVQMINEVEDRLRKIRAVVDLIMCVRSYDLLEDTLSDAGSLLLDLVEDTKAIVNESEEVQS